MADSIFTKIIKREIPATIRYEDGEFIAIDDIHPQAPVHILVIPKQPVEFLEMIPISDETFHAKLFLTGRKVAKLAGIADNYRLVLNIGKDVQAVPHIHMHILGGWKNLGKAKTEKF